MGAQNIGRSALRRQPGTPKPWRLAVLGRQDYHWQHIQLKVDAEKTDIAGELEDAIGDGKMTKGETNKLRKDIDAWVDDAIAGVVLSALAAGIAAVWNGVLSPALKAVHEKADQEIGE